MANVLITGSSSGFGYLTALELARHGHRVFATMRNPAASPQLAEIAGAEELQLSLHTLDVDDSASVQRAVDEIADRAETIDVLVNNAGFGVRGPVETLSDEELHAQFETNVFGVVRMIRAVVPAMRQRGNGTIINVSSLAGLAGVPFEGAYGASKHALEAISEALRFELRTAGIRVLLIEPGAYDTGWWEHSRQTQAFDPNHVLRAEHDRFWQAIDGTLRSDGRADPQEIAEAIQTAITDPNTPFRTVLGADAQLIIGLKRQNSFEDYENTILTTLGLNQPAATPN